MTLFINNTYPYFRIVDPESGEVVQFRGGKLELDEGGDGPEDRFYPLVMRVALATPSIQVLTSAISCPHCGEPFAGKAARAQLGTHTKANHFDRWIEGKQDEHVEAINVEIKKRQGFACEICPANSQTFGTEGELSLHTTAFHTQPPAMDDEGNTSDPDAGGGGAAVPAGIPEAKPAKPKN